MGVYLLLYKVLFELLEIVKKPFKLDGDLLEIIANYDFNVDHCNQQDRKSIYEFGKKMKFDIKINGRKSDRDKSLTRFFR